MERKPPPMADSITLDQTNPKLGDTVTFTCQISEHVKSPRIQLVATHGTDGVVYGEAGPSDQGFLLGGAGSIWLYDHPDWTVDIVATLYYWDFHPNQVQIVLATTEFTAAGNV